MRQLTSLDAQFLAMETPRTPGHVSGLAVYDPSGAPGGALTAQDMCRVVGQRIHLLPPFRWKLVEVPFGLDHPYWIEDKDFDLDFHIRETAVPPPGDDRQLAELVARVCARPLDRNHPLWELYVIHGLEGGRIATLTKIHHAVVDGVSGAEILSILLDLEPEGREIPPDRHLDLGEREPSEWEMLGRGLAGLPLQPVKAISRLPQMVPNLGAVPGIAQVPGARPALRAADRVRRFVGGSQEGELLGRYEATNVPRTRFQGPVSQHRRFSFGSLSLDRVKAIKNELGITVNDVVVGLVATGLRQWLL